MEVICLQIGSFATLEPRFPVRFFGSLCSL
uniref:Uncharacterized protein n=1 Tax=Arundo donax TaxID=35708 RepID=A0A0A9BJJ4_ARUDO